MGIKKFFAYWAKRTKKTVSLGLCMVLCLMTLGVTGCSADDEADAEVGTETSESSTEVSEEERGKLTLAVSCPADSGPSENMWFWHYIEDELNMDIEIIEVQDPGSYRSLAMASGEMPDAFFGCAFNTSELTRYGAEGLLLDFSSYINETQMPNLNELMSEYDFSKSIEAPDGGIYSLFYVQGQQWKATSEVISIYYDTELAEKAGYTERPETWDEMYAMLKAMQETSDVEGFHVLGGSDQSNNPFVYLLNSVGYLTGTSERYGSQIAMKGDVPVIPANDSEGFTRYIEIAHQLYQEGMIDPDFFTLDSTSVLAKLQSGQYGMFMQMQSVANPPENWIEWEAAPALKGETTGTQAWPMVGELINGTPMMVNIGGFVANAETENLDSVLKFADWFYGGDGENYYIYWCGETAENVEAENLYYEGVTFNGWTLDESGSKDYGDDNYNRNVNLSQHVFFGLGNGIYYSTIDQYLAGRADDLASIDGNATLNDSTNYDHCSSTNVKYHDEYLAQGYPLNVFFDEETAERVNELNVVITDYVNMQVAAFVVGSRSLDELPAFYDELDALGIDELEGYYVDYYNSIN